VSQGLAIRGLRKSYPRATRPVLAGIDLDIERGEALALRGISGSGKTTLARCLVGLERPDAGTLVLAGRTLVPGGRLERRRVQLVRPDPTSALRPYRTALQSVREPLDAFAIGAEPSRTARALEWLAALGIDPETAGRRPHALSGGQYQRVALARAFACEPELLVLDEPLSALDTITQTQILAVLQEIKAAHAPATLLISHDLAAVRRISDRIVVLHEGTLVEAGATEMVFASPSHPLTRQLLDAFSPLPFA
jgi:ABC-type dipeptide/oligopeptide/nickel transport system ATPase subunit